MQPSCDQLNPVSHCVSTCQFNGVDPNDGNSLIRQPLITTGVLFGIRNVPISAINFKRNRSIGNKEINEIPSDLFLLHERDVKLFKAFSSKHFRAGFASVRSIARKRAIATAATFDPTFRATKLNPAPKACERYLIRSIRTCFCSALRRAICIFGKSIRDIHAGFVPTNGARTEYPTPVSGNIQTLRAYRSNSSFDGTRSTSFHVTGRQLRSAVNAMPVFWFDVGRKQARAGAVMLIFTPLRDLLFKATVATFNEDCDSLTGHGIDLQLGRMKCRSGGDSQSLPGFSLPKLYPIVACLSLLLVVSADLEGTRRMDRDNRRCQSIGRQVERHGITEREYARLARHQCKRVNGMWVSGRFYTA